MRSARSQLAYTVLAIWLAATEAQWFPQYLGNHLTGTTFGVPGRNATYDYVIIGGGTAGSVVAARLIEMTNATVAVIEAGTFYELSNGNQSQVPYYSQQYSGLDWQPQIDWGMVSDAQPATGSRRIHYAQGKNLGGSSGRNQMLYNRGTKGSYDMWAEEVGDESYSWDNMLPFFAKSTKFTPPNSLLRASNATANFSIHALQEQSGPLNVHYPNYAQPISSYGPEAYSQVGMAPVQDFINGELNGFNYFTSTINPGGNTRSSAETSYLSPAMSSNRLTVYQSSVARKILFDERNHATGVEIDLQGLRPYAVKARKEVILSAGALRSPQLLMLSGIGPRATLEHLDIPLVSALEGVGQNMHDSCAIGGISFQMTTPSQTQVLSTTEDITRAEEQFRNNGTGPLTSIGADFAGWEKLPDSYRTNFSGATNETFAAWPSDWPESEIILGGSGTKPFGSEGGASDGGSYGSINVIMVATTSRGNVTINSTNVFDQPVIKTNWLLTTADQELAVAAYRRALSIVENLGARVGTYTSPNSTVLSDNELLLKYIQNEGVGPIHHASSTCRMGKKNDGLAVVDSRARVFGVDGLRIIDSSSFRFTPPGHTQAATYGHAEKLVADVIQDGGYLSMKNGTARIG